MQWLIDILAIPLGFIMRICYMIIPNYAAALLLMTILTRLLMVPMTIKQQNTSAKMAGIQSKIRAAQEKYKNDRDKLNEEMQRIYAEENYSPTAGCLPMLIQLPIFFGIVGVIYKPLTYLLQLDPAKISAATEAVKGIVNTNNTNMLELYVIQHQNTEAIRAIFPNGIDFDLNLFGFIDLSQTPSISHFTWLWLIPIAAGVAQFFSMYLSMKFSGQKPNIIMSLLFPVVSVWLAFTFPGAVGLYWVYTALIAILQSWLINKFYHPSLIIARGLISAADKRRAKFNRKEQV